MDVGDTGLTAGPPEWDLTAKFTPIGPEPIDEVGFALASAPPGGVRGRSGHPSAPSPGLAAFPGELQAIKRRSIACAPCVFVTKMPPCFNALYTFWQRTVH